MSRTGCTCETDQNRNSNCVQCTNFKCLLCWLPFADCLLLQMSTHPSGGLGIQTPKPVKDVGSYSVTEGAAATTAHGVPGTVAKPTKSVSNRGVYYNTYIPMANYSMPNPTWRVKPQFVEWEIDHTRFEIKRLLGKGEFADWHISLTTTTRYTMVCMYLQARMGQLPRPSII
jgi:hypothetical protein